MGDGQASELTDGCSTVPACTNKERLVDLLHHDPREMTYYYADVPRMLGKEVAFKLSDLHRSIVPTLAWERSSEEKGDCYVEWGVGDYAGLECAWKEKRLTYAHEVVRDYSRMAFDIDLKGDELLSALCGWMAHARPRRRFTWW